MIEIRAQGWRKNYGGKRDVFKPLSFSLKSAETLAIVGSNGSGKSTVLRMIAGVLASSGGLFQITRDGKEISSDELKSHMGFVSPYLNLYEEFSAWEHCALDARLRGLSFDEEYTRHLFDFFSLSLRRDDYIKAFSSGMKQRVKLILALYHKPQLLLLDEPTSNIDEAGVEKLYEQVRTEHRNGTAIAIATNDPRDLDLCTSRLQLGTP